MSDVGDKLENLPAVSKQLRVPETNGAMLTNPLEKESKELNDKIMKRQIAAAEQPVFHPAEVGWRPGRFRGGSPGQAQGFSDGRTGRTRWASDPRVIAQLERDPNFARTNEAPVAG